MTSSSGSKEQVLAALRARVGAPPVGSYELLLSCAVLWAQSPRLFQAGNCANVGAASCPRWRRILYAWCIAQPEWDGAIPPRITASLLGLLEVPRTYTEYTALEELAYQTARFLNYGEYYWSEEWQWNSQRKISVQEVLLILMKAKELVSK